MITQTPPRPTPVANPSRSADSARPAPVANPSRAADSARPTPAASPSRAADSARPTPAASPSRSADSARPAPVSNPSRSADSARPTPAASPSRAADSAHPAPVANPSRSADSARPAPAANPSRAADSAHPAPAANPSRSADSARPAPAASPSRAADAARTDSDSNPPTPPQADGDFDRLLTALRVIWRELREIKQLLAEREPPSSPPPAPNLRRLLADYPDFDWAGIGAVVKQRDDDGPALVEWRGNLYTRRTNPKFGAEIWFSRATGRDDAGEVSYERLITFAEPPAVEPLPKRVRDALG